MENGTVRIRLDVAYDGTNFAGWARQPGLRTVQGTLEEALERIVRRVPRGLRPLGATVAGRTDAGVHARGQVVHVDIDREAWERMPGRGDRPPQVALVHRLGGVLPRDLVVRDAAVAPGGFDARFSALSRTYRYRIADDYYGRDPLRAAWTLWHRTHLDQQAMDAAARQLIGLRDFASFCRPREGATTIRELQEFSWSRPTSGPDAGLVVAQITSDAFCHNMVRALVGSSLLVGEGRRPIEWLAEVAAARDRSRAGAVVAPIGLTLEAVAYPSDGELGKRARAVRARRLDEEVLG
ncbi:tRNA pseudouridine(38-40) synthase TruA [Rarobacter incanus]|uniref:tRNA pseudouridine synthase A n=1 Tax=Rarobacter incanus TaxID=153494 RepID=A0A542SR56_9MICO|nr:tRNA pseudouridine(38-40) synthase TruA [Rarobacter incanus]TQK77085.1 tRNA pseudouridine38-40 synthase [Rarobacter incanus]